MEQPASSTVRSNAEASARLQQQTLPGSDGEPLATDELARFGSMLGVDLRGVRIHTDDEPADAANAQAFTAGSHIWLGDDAPSPGSQAHDELMLQELIHASRPGRGADTADPAGDGEELAARQILRRTLAGEPTPTLRPPPAGAPDLRAVHRQERTPGQTEPGARYEDGNRPDPADQGDGIYQITSDSPRVVSPGTRIRWQVQQVQPTISAAGSQTTWSWMVENDPRAVASHGLPATLTVGTSAPSLSLVAVAPGVHNLTCTIQRGAARSVVRYQQIVEEGGYSELPPGTQPTPLASIADFIALVERVEAAYPRYAWQDIATKLRKEYYPNKDGADSILAAFQWDDLVDEQQGVGPLQSPPLAPGDLAALRHNAMQGQGRLPQGGATLDIGHVLTGIDSMNFPNTAGLFALHGTSGPAAATWSGDVGSALVQWATNTPLQDQTDTTREARYREFASADDMLGNVDGIGVASMAGLPPDAPLSQRLRAWYQTSPEQGVSRRWHNFCQASGFAVNNGAVSASAREYIREQVRRFANAYNVTGPITDAFILSGGGLGGMGAPENVELTIGWRIQNNLDWFVDRFIQELQAGLSTEPAP